MRKQEFAFINDLFGTSHFYSLGSLMRRSKLEIYIDTLESLAFYGPMRLTRITYKAKLNCSILKTILNELMQGELVEERKLKENLVVYAVTPKARTILSQFKELRQIIPITQESV